MERPTAVLPHRRRGCRRGEHRVSAAAGRRDRREHAARLRIDLLDAVLGDLKQVPAVKGGSRVRRDIYGAHRLSALQIESVQFVAGREPHMPAVEGNADRKSTRLHPSHSCAARMTAFACNTKKKIRPK